MHGRIVVSSRTEDVHDQVPLGPSSERTQASLYVHEGGHCDEWWCTQRNCSLQNKMTRARYFIQLNRIIYLLWIGNFRFTMQRNLVFLKSLIDHSVLTSYWPKSCVGFVTNCHETIILIMFLPNAGKYSCISERIWCINYFGDIPIFFYNQCALCCIWLWFGAI